MSGEALDRRGFLSTVGTCAGGACLACTLGPLTGSARADDPLRHKREIDFYDRLDDNRIQCHVCPLDCTLTEGETCFCRTRTNVGGRLYTRAYNNPCIMRYDAIEKLPLNHFRPGTQTLSIATGGCNCRCLYCQNWQQSQKVPDELETFKLSPRQAVEAARKKNIDTIAFTYTEPIAFLEYAKDIAIAAKEVGMRVVVATAGFVNREALLDFAQHVDAFSIALKGFDEDYYYRALGIRLQPVLDAIETIANDTDCWLELTNLIVPTYNDDPHQFKPMTRWIHEHIGDDVPVHFARFVPMYKLKNLPQTPVQSLEQARDIALKAGLKYVYTSNIAPHEGNHTYCDRCGQALIQRLGFKVLEKTIKKWGGCSKCRNKLPGVWT